MAMLIYEVVEEAAKKKTKKEKIEVLKKNESWALKDVLRGTYDESISWNLPAGKPPYTPNQGHNSASSLLRQNVQFKYFVSGGPGETMMKAKREKLYVSLLESIHPKDSELVISMISKNPLKGISKSVVEEAFPNLIKK